MNGSRTWFVSNLAPTNISVGVLNFGGDVQMTIENVAIRCKGQECGIRIADCRQGTPTFLSKIGIFNMRGYGLCVIGGGSRPIFAQDMTVFGTGDGYPVPGIGILLQGVVDCRVSNIEVMGARIGMQVYNGYTYGDNLHFWTGPMRGRDNDEGIWWKGTRGIVLGHGAVFSGSEIYPDACYYAIEQNDPNGAISINKLFYWEDGSMWNAPDRDGAFFHAPRACRARSRFRAVSWAWAVEEDGMVRVFLRRETDEPTKVRFVTTYMGDWFRPVDHGSLRAKSGATRAHEVRADVGGIDL